MNKGKDDRELFFVAAAAYQRFCKKNGFTNAQPSESDSAIGTKYVRLKNINGALAKFNIKTRRIETE
jgi:hypothetical protein